MTNGREASLSPANPFVIRNSSFLLGMLFPGLMLPFLRLRNCEVGGTGPSGHPWWDEPGVCSWGVATVDRVELKSERLQSFLLPPSAGARDAFFYVSSAVWSWPYFFFSWGGGLRFDTHEVVAKPASPPPEADAIIIGTIE
jgi:hypothetical protein